MSICTKFIIIILVKFGKMQRKRDCIEIYAAQSINLGRAWDVCMCRSRESCGSTVWYALHSALLICISLLHSCIGRCWHGSVKTFMDKLKMAAAAAAVITGRKPEPHRCRTLWTMFEMRQRNDLCTEALMHSKSDPNWDNINKKRAISHAAQRTKKRIHSENNR